MRNKREPDFTSYEAQTALSHTDNSSRLGTASLPAFVLLSLRTLLLWVPDAYHVRLQFHCLTHTNTTGLRARGESSYKGSFKFLATDAKNRGIQ